MHGLAALCHTVRKGGYIGSRSTYTWRASSLLDIRSGTLQKGLICEYGRREKARRSPQLFGKGSGEKEAMCRSLPLRPS